LNRILPLTFAIRALLLAAAWMLGAGGAFAATITNTAQVRWQQGAAVLVAQSNTVTIDVTGISSQVAVLALPGDAAATLDMPGGQCGGKALPIAAVEQGVLAAEKPDVLEQMKVGQPILFRLTVSRAALDAGRVDTLDVTLTSASGDVETVTVSETGKDTGVFFGAVPTSAIPPTPVSGDCRLSVSDGDKITVTWKDATSASLVAQASVAVVADPFGVVFDSEDGTPVNGVRVTLVDAATGAPAKVLADDGRTAWPSTVITGQDVIDAGGNVWPMPAGEYRFPLAALGRYRLKIEPPAPYVAPSSASADSLAALRRPDGGELQIAAGSFGGEIVLSSTAAVRVDVPIDPPAVAVTLAKTASREVAQPGDAVFYTVTVRNPDGAHARRGVVLTDRPAAALRLRKDSIRIDGVAPGEGAVTVSGDGRVLAVTVGAIAPGATRTVTYAMTVRPDAAAGNAVNRVDAADWRGTSATASANLRVERDNLASTMTLIGRVSVGDCGTRGARPGLGGVRLMLEDGSFAVTDADGRYHFEGLMPGTHVVEAQEASLPEAAKLVDCAASTRSAGSASSRFVTGQGGSLAVADFAVVMAQGATAPAAAKAADDGGRGAAGGDTDWLALGDGPTDFLFPGMDHNPRAPTVRVVIRHREGETVLLKADGAVVDKLAFDGAKKSGTGYAVSVWRGLPLVHADTRLEAEVRRADGSVTAVLTRVVHFAASAARVELVPERSMLLADGRTRPVVAVRVLDRTGHPVHAGMSGPFGLSAPYESAGVIDAMQARVLSGMDRAAPTWTVKGDDGVALIELAPTMVSGGLDLTFPFVDREVKRQQVLETWVAPGAQKWTLVGLAEGAVGAKTIADHMQRADAFDSDLGRHARVALYAKGRIKGKYLVTAAYDSAKQRAEQRLLGGLDPRAYYTVFADGSDRRFDAASTGKLYLRVESDHVRALYGDFSTGFDHAQLARYERTMTGVKAEARMGKVRLQGFAAKTATTHRRDQIPGGGISGPYRLSSRAIVPNSETVTLEVRDRMRSEIVVSSQVLVRFVDYDVDLFSGTISFRQPVLSRDDAMNPRTIVVDYEIDSLRGEEWNAGLRGEMLTKGDRVRIGATAITDAGGAGDGTAQGRTNLGAVDARVRVGAGTEIRAEGSVSKATGGEARTAWLVEAEHHDAKLDVLAYARALDTGFGLGQTSVGELGRRKVGVDGRYALNEAWSVAASGAIDDALGEASHRDMVQMRAIWTTPGTEARLGLARYGEHLADGTGSAVTLVEAGATRRLLDNKLEVTAAAGFALGSSDASSYQPPRYRFGARYAITPSVRLVGDYEMTKGSAGETRTVRAGLELAPWTGARILTTLGQQSITEQGKRAFAAYGLAQSLPVGRHLTVDASVDGNRVIGGRGFASTSSTAVVGGATSTSVIEDFTAYTFGASWRAGLWSATGRAELRQGSLDRRKGLTLGAIRQLGEGSVVGGGMTLTQAHEAGGAMSQVASVALSLAHRPADAPLAFLAKLELRSDKVVAGADSTALTVDGDARSRRVVASFSGDWAPFGREQGQRVQRTEVGLFAAVRHNMDRYQGYDLAGTTVLGGLDLRIGLGARVEIGGTATLRRSLSDGTTAFAVGPQLGFVPADNAMIVIGYNLTGFRDRDFAEARNTRKGVFAMLRLKFDSHSLASLGIGR
jgi:uncharacterized repeat protein (TIGR01451 family)